MVVNIGIDEHRRGDMSARLNVLLADLYVLYQKTWGFHWNLRGPRFNDMHLFFEKQFALLREHVDLVAERVRQLGFFADGTLQDFLEKTRLAEQKSQKISVEQMVEELLADHELVICLLREDLAYADKECNDMGTNNLLTDLMQAHEKEAWMLRSLTH